MTERAWLIDPEYEAVIGLEVHCQLATQTKIFCSCRARLGEKKSVADETSNSNTCAICAGHPGTLPVLNRKVLEFAAKAGLATGCRINLRNTFARKNYFYPDLPKGYQISQFEDPICEGGFLFAGRSRISIIRIHMEEDAGKNVHQSGYSLVNLNRAGVPLIEIVSGPDIRTPEEAGQYLRSLYAIVMYLEICDGNLQEGNFRCDANVSVRKRGSAQYGTRVEIKNINSFRFVERAIEHEANRQITLIQSGGKVVQETRQYDPTKDATFSMRTKEEAQDYRYFPDPDLIEIKLTQEWVDKIKDSLPELPADRKKRFMSEFGLNDYDAQAMIEQKSWAEFFEQALSMGKDPKTLASRAKTAANLISSEVTRLLNESNSTLSESRFKPSHLAELLEELIANSLSSSNAKILIQKCFESGEQVSVLVEKFSLKQVSDLSSLDPIIDKVLLDFTAQVTEYRSGKEKVMSFLVGQVMKQSGGKANPQVVQDLLKKKIMGGGS
jgi:aspartyl-tRNA(Asn)/glutamyl-tRNA(Gln) amidotransferase subunit B